MAVGGDVHRVLLDLAVALESEPDEVVVLPEDLRRRAREVEPDLRDAGPEVIDRERHLVGKIFLVFPDDPAQPRVDQSELVARGRDGEHPFQAEVPLPFGVQEGEDEASRGGIDMDRDLESGPAVVGVERLVEPLDVVVEPRPGDAGDRHDADRILVAEPERRLDVERRVLHVDRHGAQLDLPQLAELLPDDLVGRTHHQVGFVEGLAGSLAAVAPAEPGCHAAQHAGLRRADARSSGLPLRLLGRVPEVGEDVQAAAAHDGHARVLRLVDVIDVDRLVHQPGGVVVHVGRDERGQVQARLGLGVGLLLDHLVGHLGGRLALGYELRGCGRTHLARAEYVGQRVFLVFQKIHTFQC